jgi:hypothetical protein
VRVGRGWERGRQQSGYDKLLLLEGARFDLYLLRFPVGSCVPMHRDPVDGAGHLRVNVVVVPARRGGEFSCQGAILDWARLKVFRSDLCEHAVSEIEAGTRWVLSLGVALRVRRHERRARADRHRAKHHFAAGTRS